MNADSAVFILVSLTLGLVLGFFLQRALRKRGFYKRFEQGPPLPPEQARRQGRVVAAVALPVGLLLAVGTGYFATRSLAVALGAALGYLVLTAVFFVYLRAKVRAMRAQ